MAGAWHLNTYMEERLLTPLGLMFTGLSKPSVQEVKGPNQAAVEQTVPNDTTDDIEDVEVLVREDCHDEIVEWLEGIHGCDIEEEEV